MGVSRPIKGTDLVVTVLSCLAKGQHLLIVLIVRYEDGHQYCFNKKVLIGKLCSAITAFKRSQNRSSASFSMINTIPAFFPVREA